MNKAPISVIITTFNDYEYLDQAIQSVLAQKLLPSELIIVEDDSRNLDAEIITRKYSNNSKNVQVLFFRKENGGASSARNFGLKKAKHNYVFFLDVDDKMLSNNLLEKYELIKDLDDNYFGVYGGSIRSTGEEEVFPDFDGIANTDLIDEQTKGIPGGSPFFLFHKSALIEVGGFDEELQCNEDYDILIRLSKTGKKVKGCTPAGFYRNLRSGSLSRPNDPIKKFTRVMFFLDKAERLSFYSPEFLKKRRMYTYITCVKGLLINKSFFQAFKYARIGFKFSKPVTIEQKLVYLASFSFININSDIDSIE